MTSSNRRVRGGEREREMGGGGRLGAVWRKGNGRESPPPPDAVVGSTGRRTWLVMALGQAMIQMEFEFLQTLANSKDTFPRSKILK
jgi:hypothetical protein